MVDTMFKQTQWSGGWVQLALWTDSSTKLPSCPIHITIHHLHAAFSNLYNQV